MTTKKYTNRELAQELTKLKAEVKYMNKALRSEIGSLGTVFTSFKQTTEESQDKFHDFMLIELDRRSRNGSRWSPKQITTIAVTALTALVIALQVIAKLIER